MPPSAFNPKSKIVNQKSVGLSEGRIRVGVFGAGGLGRAACRIIGMKRELRLTAICDSKGLVASPEGLACEVLTSSSGDLVSSYLSATSNAGQAGQAASNVNINFASRNLLAGEDARESGTKQVATVPMARHSGDPLGEMIEFAEDVDAMLITLPNMPNEFIPGVIERFVRAKRHLVFVDVLKRTAAVEQMFQLDGLVKQAESVVVTGCGATPGLLTAAAVLAAQSFIEVERVDIWWGVGIANWDAYKATIREDIAHLPGYTVERAKAMSDPQVQGLLDQRNGILELHGMEHADDLLLERAGVVASRDQVEVGGVMDTRHPKKPVSTTMTLTGVTFEGKRASHRFILGDETSMAANVVGPALGYLKRALWLKAHAIYGVFGSTDLLPMVVH